MRAVDVNAGDTVAVSAAAGGVGTVVVQLLRTRGATVLGIASRGQPRTGSQHTASSRSPTARVSPSACAPLRPTGIDAFIDLFGPEYVQLAVDLGIKPDRIETIIAREKAHEVGAKVEGSADASTTEVLAEMADLVASGRIEIPIAATYPLDEVRDAFAELEARHTHGKIVLIPGS